MERRHILLMSTLLSVLSLGVVATPAAAEPPPPPESCPSGMVALTFDDGPDPEWTVDILDTLEGRGAWATFFVMGHKTDSHPEITRRTYWDGHAVGNHTWDHPRLTEISDDEIRWQLRRTDEAIAEAGVRVAPIMRPPGFRADARVRSILREEGYVAVMRTLNPRDWEWPGVEELTRRVLDGLHEDAIIVLHDGIPQSEDTAAALPGIIDGIHEQGYCTGLIGDDGEIAPPRGPIDGPFWDADGHLFERDVARIHAAGLTSGCAPGRYCPDRSTTRAQTASFLVRALDLPHTSAQRFTDTASSTHRHDIERLAEAGVTRGCNPPANDRYCPRDHVTRGEMAAFLSRALGLPGADPSFADARGHRFARDIGALERAEITTGCGSRGYCPDDPITRGQMAAFLNRADLDR